MNQRKKLFKRAGSIGRNGILADRRGSTLIEVIVSVLIVGIAFVPLMVGLNAALRVNSSNEKELYAENVASNVVEITKTYGTKGLKNLADEQGADSTKGIAKLLDGASMTSNGSGTVFTLQNLKAGTDKVYQAKVEFSTWNDKQNDFSGYPAVEGVDGSIIINFYEDKMENVLNYFWNYASGYNTELTKDELQSHLSEWLSREIVINIEEGTGEDAGSVIVNKVICYKAVNAEIDHKYVFKSPSNAVPAPYEAQKMDIGKLAELSKSLIVTYRPLRDKKGNNYKINDRIKVAKGVAGELHLYAFCENGSTLRDKGYTVELKIEDTTGESSSNLFGYSNFLDTSFTCIGCTKEDTFGEATAGKQSNMKNVKVTVFDKEGTELFSKTTSIIEVE